MVEHRAGHCHQAGGFVFLPTDAVRAWTGAGGRIARQISSAIDFDHDQTGNAGYRDGQGLLLMSRSLEIALSGHLGADLLGDPAQLAVADLNVRQLFERFGRHLERRVRTAGEHDLLEDRRAEVMAVNPECGTEREKNPDGRSGSDTSARRRRRSRRGR